MAEYRIIKVNGTISLTTGKVVLWWQVQKKTFLFWRNVDKPQYSNKNAKAIIEKNKR